MTDFATTVPGYPRLGEGRRYKRLLDSLWSGTISHDAFAASMTELRHERLRLQATAGLDLLPCGDFSLYDHVLDTAIMLGCIPDRFGWQGGPIDLSLYFAMARGRDGLPPCEMTKWFDTNYHYLVPELPTRFTLTSNWTLDAYRVGRQVVGAAAKPVLLGPFTFLKLARLTGAALTGRLEELVPLYQQIFTELAAEGATLAQVDEPALAGEVTDEEWDAVAQFYQAIARQRLSSDGQDIELLLQTYYGDVAPRYSALCSLPVAGLGLDLVRGRAGNLAALQAHGFPSDKLLVAGVVDGRNVWRTDLDATLAIIQQLTGTVSPDRLLLSASCPLLHLPESVAPEDDLPTSIREMLCFARERLGELVLLAQAARHGVAAVQAEWEYSAHAHRTWQAAPERARPAVQARVAALTEADFSRVPYAERQTLQHQHLNLPLLPTTTIGSFPQTAELRRARANATKDPAAYHAAVMAEIARVIRLQEEVGLDVLVHGEPERNDMVQFFAEKLTGFVTTREGWVQSYGSRCVRPPIIAGDVERPAPMTLAEARFAQSLTSKPVKGMLTGPVTMIQWSFVREDIPRQQIAYQIALALRAEVHDLEREAGLSVIQIDEPAIREGLPLRRADWPDYLAWAVHAFRLAMAGAAPRTQIHTHMCYSEFGDIMAAIAAMDADVISIEDARSDGAMLSTLRDFRYPAGIGPGVYDIHSPNIPTVEFMADKLRAVLGCLPPHQVWVNPDCGLKTRRYQEVVPALKNMVAAAQQARGMVG